MLGILGCDLEVFLQCLPGDVQKKVLKTHSATDKKFIHVAMSSSQTSIKNECRTYNLTLPPFFFLFLQLNRHTSRLTQQSTELNSAFNTDMFHDQMTISIARRRFRMSRALQSSLVPERGPDAKLEPEWEHPRGSNGQDHGFCLPSLLVAVRWTHGRERKATLITLVAASHEAASLGTQFFGPHTGVGINKITSPPVRHMQRDPRTLSSPCVRGTATLARSSSPWTRTCAHMHDTKKTANSHVVSKRSMPPSTFSIAAACSVQSQ